MGMQWPMVAGLHLCRLLMGLLLLARRRLEERPTMAALVIRQRKMSCPLGSDVCSMIVIVKPV